LQKWKIQESYVFFPEKYKLIADIDPWDKYLNVTILREDSRLVNDAIREGALLLSSPMKGLSHPSEI